MQLATDSAYRGSQEVNNDTITESPVVTMPLEQSVFAFLEFYILIQHQQVAQDTMRIYGKNLEAVHTENEEWVIEVVTACAQRSTLYLMKTITRDGYTQDLSARGLRHDSLS